MRPSGGPSPARADAQRNRERVLEAVFAFEGDLRDLSLDDIAHDAGVGRSTLFRHFPTRDDLLVAVTRRAIDEGHATLRAALAEGGTAAEVLQRLSRDIARLATRFRILRAHRHVVERLVGDEVGGDPLTAWIVAAQARGELRSELTPQWIAEMLVAIALASADQLAEQDEPRVAAMLAATLTGAFVVPARTSDAPAGRRSPR